MPKICLLILDGFGVGTGDRRMDAIACAHTPTLDELFRIYPWTTLDASGPAVGLPEGQFGNSEIGHMTIGAGRVLPDLSTLISERIQTFQPTLRPGVVVHLIGIYSHGRVHGDATHLDELIKVFTKLGHRVVLHLISDGRDTDRHAFLTDLKQLLTWINPELVTIGSISGRFYAMDRDDNWERVKMADDAMNGIRLTNLDPVSYVESMYAQGLDDEMLPPVSFQKTDLATGESIFTNYRPDRLIELLTLFQEHQRPFFTLVKIPHFQGNNYLFDIKRHVEHTLNDVLYQNGVSQLRVAETEKYAHVTYFFDGERDAPNPLKETILIPSNKVVSHANAPEMKAKEITDVILANAEKFDVIVANFANADMVGHTGNFGATVRALEEVDRQIQRIYDKIVKRFRCWLVITADHGNADQMVLPTGEPLKTHTLARVPFLVTDERIILQPEGGTIGQIAPTLLEHLKIPKPAEMTAKSLVVGEVRAEKN